MYVVESEAFKTIRPICSMVVLLSTRNENDWMSDRNQLQEQLISSGVVFFGVLHFPLPFIKESPHRVIPWENIPQEVHQRISGDNRVKESYYDTIYECDLASMRVRCDDINSSQPIWFRLVNLFWFRSADCFALFTRALPAHLLSFRTKIST